MQQGAEGVPGKEGLIEVEQRGAPFLPEGIPVEGVAVQMFPQAVTGIEKSCKQKSCAQLYDLEPNVPAEAVIRTVVQNALAIPHNPEENQSESHESEDQALKADLDRKTVVRKAIPETIHLFQPEDSGSQSDASRYGVQEPTQRVSRDTTSPRVPSGKGRP